MSSHRQVLRRTLDYLGLKYPWLGAVWRSPWVAAVVVSGYLAALAYLVAVVYANQDNDGWTEVVKSYSPLFFDVLVIFLATMLFLMVRGYYLEEGTRIAPGVVPDSAFFKPLWGKSLSLNVSGAVFVRHPSIAAVLDALPMDQSDYFLAHAGALDIPKLCLREAVVTDTEVVLTLGAGSFREFFFTHHFADFVLSRSMSKDAGGQETLRKLLHAGYARAYKPFFEGGSQLGALDLTPNTLGVTGLVCLEFKGQRLYVLQHRGWHESAARGQLQLSYAGTINAYPCLLGRTVPGNPAMDLAELANDEFEDEVMAKPLGQWLKHEMDSGGVTHELAGMCCNSQYLFQPELFVWTTVRLRSQQAMQQARARFGQKAGQALWLTPDLQAVLRDAAVGHVQLRPLCKVALETVYAPRLYSDVKQGGMASLCENPSDQNPTDFLD